MAGIYVHIPFCKSRCIYCDFYSTTLASRQDGYVDALVKELEIRKDYLHGEQVETIYIGGGTPSQLSEQNIHKLFHALPHPVDGGEATFECNPDDISDSLVKTLHQVGVNRISMGVQSFSDARLKFLNRRHNSSQVRDAVRLLRDNGIHNISIDLIFGFPNETVGEWESDIDEALRLDVNHLSAYSLMFEEGTPLYRMLEKGIVQEIDEDVSREMYYLLIDRLEAAGYEHYEISNFARPGYASRHNSSYWAEVPYLGIGAGAHSYDKNSRQWNIADIDIYINKVETGDIPFTREIIDGKTRYNDMVTTALRTRKGINLEKCGEYRKYFIENAHNAVNNGLLSIDGDYAHLTREGLYVSDDVMSDLMFID